MPPHNHARHIYADMWRATYPFNGALYAFRGRRGGRVTFYLPLVRYLADA